MGVLWLYLLYLRAYISVAIVSRSVGAEREIDVVTLALQPAVFIPCRADVAGNRHFRIARQSQEIYLVFSRSFQSRSVIRLEVPHNPREEIERWVFTMSLKYLILKFQWFRRYTSGLSSRFFIFILLLRRFRLSLQLRNKKILERYFWILCLLLKIIFYIFPYLFHVTFFTYFILNYLFANIH